MDDAAEPTPDAAHDIVVISQLQGESDLAAWWSDRAASLEARGIAIYPLTAWPQQEGVAWPEDLSADEFLSIAERIGVRLVYALLTHFDEDMADRMGATDATDRQGQLAHIGLWWIHQGIRHACTVWADWYLPLVAKTVEDRRAAQDRLEAAIPEMAAKLAHNPAFWAVPGGLIGRRDFGREMFPDLSPEMLGRVLREATLIRSTVIVPEQERATAQKARELMATGVKITEAARRLGMTRDRLGRLLALYPEPADQEPG